MISSIEYEILCALQDDPRKGLDLEDEQYDTMIKLRRDHLIQPCGLKNEPTRIIYSGLSVTPEGVRAMEEYKLTATNLQLQQKSVNAAEEANRISEEAKNLANKSNNLSKGAIIISILSLLVCSLFIRPRLFQSTTGETSSCVVLPLAYDLLPLELALSPCARILRTWLVRA